MSTLNITDLLRELQAGEEARARIPQLEQTAADYQRKMDTAQAHNSALENSIIDYKRTIDGLNAKVRSLEVERDDAGFRELETQDKLTTLLNAFRGVQHDIGEAVLHVDPPKPGPVASQPVSDAPVPVTAQGQREASPTVPTAATQSPAASYETAASPESASQALYSGQSDTNPPHPAPSTEQTQPSASGAAVEPKADAPSTIEYRPFESAVSGANTRPNAGKAHWEKPFGMSEADWLASGGQSY